MFRAIFKFLLKRGQIDKSDEAHSSSTEPLPGAIFSFKTAPFFNSSSADTGRYATFKILGIDSQFVALAVLNGIWPQQPSFKLASACAILVENRFAFTGRPAIFGVNRKWFEPEEDLLNVKFLGRAELSNSERLFADRVAQMDVGVSYSGLNFVNSAAEGEWRWQNDRIALEEERSKHMLKVEIERKAVEERYSKRLKHLTWEKLLSETPFEGWHPSPPILTRAL